MVGTQRFGAVSRHWKTPLGFQDRERWGCGKQKRWDVKQPRIKYDRLKKHVSPRFFASDIWFLKICWWFSAPFHPWCGIPPPGTVFSNVAPWDGQIWGQRTASAVYDSKTRWATCLLGTQASHALPIFAPLGGFKVSRWLCQWLIWLMGRPFTDVIFSPIGLVGVVGVLSSVVVDCEPWWTLPIFEELVAKHGKACNLSNFKSIYVCLILYILSSHWHDRHVFYSL